ncbi:TetR/AcrR family transcriptional regulator [Bacteroidota bacterium]
MKKNTKEIILEKAYMLFLEKGYDGVSISALQKEIGIGRATMYHHFSSKQDLFEAVIDMNFKSMEEKEDLSAYEDVLLSEFLKTRIEKTKLVLESSSIPKNVGMLNYFILSFQALEIKPEYAERSHQMHEHELAKWKLIIQNSIDREELKENIDVEKAARLFMDARHGIGITSTFKTSLEENINEIDEMYQFVFSLIKCENI